MDITIITLLAGLFTGGGIYGFVRFLIERHDTKKGKRDQYTVKLDELLKVAQESKVNHSQTHLVILMNHYPKEHKAILAECTKYFGELHADSWVFGLVQKWAAEEGVPIKHLELLHERNLKERK